MRDALARNDRYTARMSRWPQFRLGCVFWLTASVAFLLWALRGSSHGSVSFGVFVIGGIALVIWGAFQISEKR